MCTNIRFEIICIAVLSSIELAFPRILGEIERASRSCSGEGSRRYDPVFVFLQRRSIFFELFFKTGLTRWEFGCILYDIGSAKGRCSLQNRRTADEKAARWPDPDPKKNRKIFGIWFDKAQKCAIVYITRLIRSWL